MATTAPFARLDRPVDPAVDHVLGPDTAGIVLVEYGSYACPYCRAANERIADVRDRLEDRLRYVFRHRPLTGSDIARRAAELVERIGDPKAFWSAHVTLMTRSPTLTEDDLRAVAREHGVADDEATRKKARARVEADEQSARASGVQVTPTFFINGRRYDGPWDSASFTDAMLGSLEQRLRVAALQFASWAPSTGALLLVATIVAVLLTNSPAGADFTSFWAQSFGLRFAGRTFELPLLAWVNDGFLTIFFLVVGLEIKREFTVGSLSNRKAAALPIAAAVGGMAAPAALYALVIPAGPWAHGWGVPMSTDTAFAVALIAMMGSRVPVELRIFLTAAAIVDDIGAITVVAFFYSESLHFDYLATAAAVAALIALLNHWRFYQVAPYAALGLVLWFCVHESGLHATLSGVVVALFMPTRPPANLPALLAQAGAVAEASAPREGEVLRHRLSLPALRALDAIHDRLESPADRLLRLTAPWSSFFVLPIFALANGGVLIGAAAWGEHAQLTLAIAAGLIVGKPLGLVGLSALAVRLGLAAKPGEYSWAQVMGAGALAGIGFTMSLFVATQAFPVDADFAAAKIAVFGASLVSAALGVAILWRVGRRAD